MALSISELWDHPPSSINRISLRTHYNSVSPDEVTSSALLVLYSAPSLPSNELAAFLDCNYSLRYYSGFLSLQVASFELLIHSSYLVIIASFEKAGSWQTWRHLEVMTSSRFALRVAQRVAWACYALRHPWSCHFNRVHTSSMVLLNYCSMQRDLAVLLQSLMTMLFDRY